MVRLCVRFIEIRLKSKYKPVRNRTRCCSIRREHVGKTPFGGILRKVISCGSYLTPLLAPCYLEGILGCLMVVGFSKVGGSDYC
jgi:hypothetical protein